MHKGTHILKFQCEKGTAELCYLEMKLIDHNLTESAVESSNMD